MSNKIRAAAAAARFLREGKQMKVEVEGVVGLGRGKMVVEYNPDDEEKVNEIFNEQVFASVVEGVSEGTEGIGKGPTKVTPGELLELAVEVRDLARKVCGEGKKGVVLARGAARGEEKDGSGGSDGGGPSNGNGN